MIYVISSVHPLSDSRIYNRQVLSLAKEYEVRFFAQAVEGWQGEVPYEPLRRGKSLGVRLVNICRLLRVSLNREARVIHFHDPELLPVGMLAKLLAGKKIVYDVHENYRKTIRNKEAIPRLFRGMTRILFGFFEDLACRYFDLVLVVTDEMAKQLPGNVHTLKNYPLISFIPPQRQVSQEALKLVYVGLLSQGRGILNMIEEVKECQVPVTFDIIGHFNSPTFRDRAMEAMAGQDNIRYIRSLPYTDFFRRLAEYDVGMMCLLPNPNHITSLPNKMFEYMSMGMAIIASDFPSWREIIGGSDCGILVDPLDSGEISATIAMLDADREKLAEMGRRGQKAYRDKYNWQSQERKLLALYRRMLGDEHD